MVTRAELHLIEGVRNARTFLTASVTAFVFLSTLTIIHKASISLMTLNLIYFGAILLAVSIFFNFYTTIAGADYLSSTNDTERRIYLRRFNWLQTISFVVFQYAIISLPVILFPNAKGVVIVLGVLITIFGVIRLSKYRLVDF